MVISAMGKNIAGRDPGGLWWAAVIFGMDRNLQKDEAAEGRPQGDEGRGTGYLGYTVQEGPWFPTWRFCPRRGHVAVSGDMEML